MTQQLHQCLLARQPSPRTLQQRATLYGSRSRSCSTTYAVKAKLSTRRCTLNLHGGGFALRPRPRAQINAIVLNSYADYRRRRPWEDVCHRGYHELSYTETDPQDPIGRLEYTQRLDIPQGPPTDANAIKGISEGTSWVLVELHAAPWNPADQNTVQGKYPPPQHPWNHLRYSSPSSSIINVASSRRIVAGSEGMGRVVDIVPPNSSSEDQPELSVGDWVVLGLPGLGSLRSHIWLPHTALLQLKMDNHTCTVEDARFALSTLLQLGGTAHALLAYRHCYSDSNHPTATTVTTQSLRPLEDWAVIQNAALSNVGYMVQQLVCCMTPPSYPKSTRTTLINVVRSSDPKPEPFVIHYTSFDQSQNSTVRLYYITEEEIQACRKSRQLWEFLSTSSSSLLQDSPPIVLALDAVGGPKGSHMIKLLDQGGISVTYGALSQQPLTVPAPQLIFPHKMITGHWHSGWIQRASVEEKQGLLNHLVQLLGPNNTMHHQETNNNLHRTATSSSLLLPPVRVVPLSQAKATLMDLYQPKERDNGNETESNAGVDIQQNSHTIPLPTRPKLVFDLTEQ